MKTENSKNVFVFSKDLLLLGKIRKEVHSLNVPISLYVNKLNDLHKLSPGIIIIDQRFFKDLKILPKYFNTKIIYITSNSSYENIDEIFKNKAHDIIFDPINYPYLFCLIRKYLGLIITKECKETVYHGITLCRDSSSITYNRCKIFLSEGEFTTIEGIISNSFDSSISEPSLEVTVCRINKKCKEGIGLRLIKKRTKKNYYITI